MPSRFLSLFICVVVSLAVMMQTEESFAQKKAAAKPGLAAVLGEISWGDRKDDVIQKLRTDMINKLNDDSKLRSDRVLMQDARRRVLDNIKVVEESYTRLQGDRSGYEVSVVAGEFTKNNGESLLRVRDEVAQRFYFFLDGQLYKMVVAYNPDYLANVGFEAFVAQAARRYGRPAGTDYGRVLGEENLVLAQWNDGESELRVENKKEFFATFTMAFSDAVVLKRLEASNRKAGGQGRQSDEVSATVQGLSDSALNDRNERVVDHLVGDIKVNLNDGRPKEEEVRHSEESGATASAETGKGASKSKTKAATKSKASTKKKGGRDFSDIEAKGGGDDLIIY
ncbi:MAG: hypothetical protein H0U74_05640 [Bradymonadaceae bacterium]|nr:hypothetical protein [Lujinxingiaceae bacterium]